MVAAIRNVMWCKHVAHFMYTRMPMKNSMEELRPKITPTIAQTLQLQSSLHSGDAACAAIVTDDLHGCSILYALQRIYHVLLIRIPQYAGILENRRTHNVQGSFFTLSKHMWKARARKARGLLTLFAFFLCAHPMKGCP